MVHFEITEDTDKLILTLPPANELTVAGCLAFAVAAVSLLAMGMLAVFQEIRNTSDLSAEYTPTGNHFGFLWLICTLALLVLLPVYFVRMSRAPLVLTFERLANSVFRNGRRLTPLSRIEYVLIRETKDPDERYLYVLYLVYGDGRALFIFNGYDERETMNLANRISGFAHCRLKWA